MSKLRWHPETGASQVFSDDETPPDGWLDHHPGDPNKAQPKPSGVGMTKAEMADALKAGGITPPSTATAAELAEMLTEALVKNLAEREIPYAPDSSLRDMLALAASN